MKRIPVNELNFHPHSFADPAGRLFWWKGELYRGLRADSATLFRKLLCNGTLQRLADEGLLVQTEATDFAVDGYEMVVRQRVIPFASYPEEWCPAMLKDAALAMLNLIIELARCGLTLKDAHPWNLLFDRGRPVYVDLTSIIPLGDERKWYGQDEFRRFYLNPLLLMAHSQERIARRLLLEYEGVLEADVLALTRSSSFSRVVAALIRTVKKRKIRLVRRSSDRQATPSGTSLLDYFQKTKQQIEGLSVTGETFSDDTGCFEPVFTRQESWTSRQRAVREFLKQRKPSSVLDVGVSDNGWYSIAATVSGSTSLAMGTDSTVLTKMYQVAYQRRLPLLPVFMDFTDPTPARGLCSHWSVAASERFKCELVLALAEVHDFFLKRSLTCDLIVDGLASFSKRWLIAEFVPLQNGDSREVQPVWRRSSYTLENFSGALKKRFSSVEAQPDGAGRVLLFCAK